MLNTTIVDWSGRGDTGAVVSARNALPIAEAVAAERDGVSGLLAEYGAVLFRGFDVEDANEFSNTVDQLGWRPMDYVYRSTPRSAVARNVHTATEFPANLSIPMHSENAFQRDWPMHLAFCCLQPALIGGHTPLASLDKVSHVLGETLMDEFEARRVKYVRHYQPYVDLSWETVFQTNNRDTLAAYCRANHIEHTWLANGTLRTSQVCQGTMIHPERGARVFFNQAHLFHVTSQGTDAAEAMIDLFGEEVPRNAFFGDGGEIHDVILDNIRKAFSGASFSFSWKQGDVLLIDNMRYAHGRQPFTGDRHVVVSLRDPYSAAHAR